MGILEILSGRVGSTVVWFAPGIKIYSRWPTSATVQVLLSGGRKRAMHGLTPVWQERQTCTLEWLPSPDFYDDVGPSARRFEIEDLARGESQSLSGTPAQRGCRAGRPHW